MADSSFDVVSKLDRQEVDNAVNQTAKEIANRYCTALAKHGFFHIYNPYTGLGMNKGRDGVLHQHWSSWCSSIFLLLADRYC